MIQYWWVPILLATTVWYTYCSKWANDSSDMQPIVIMWLIQVFGLWPIVAKFSRSLFFDGMLFDGIMVLTYVFVMALLGATHGFGLAQWAGTILVVAGLLLVKMG